MKKEGKVLFFVFWILFITSFVSALPIAYHSGTINSNQIWNNSYEHRINGSVIFQRNLTIEPGAIVIFEGYYQLQIYNPSASLNATGNSTHFITFMSNSSTPTMNDWQYIRFYKTIIPSYLSYVNISSGYQALTFSNDSAPVIIKNSVFNKNNISITLAADSKNKIFDNITLDNSVYPLDLSGTDLKNVTLNNFNVRNFTNSVYIHTTGNGTTSLNNFSLYNSTRDGFYCISCTNVSFYNVSVLNSSSVGIWIRNSNNISLSKVNILNSNISLYFQDSDKINLTQFYVNNSNSTFQLSNVNDSSLFNGIINNVSQVSWIDINNISVFNLTISETSASRGFWIRGDSSDVLISNLKMYNCSSSYLLYLDGLNNTNLTNFEMWGSGPLGTTYDNMLAVAVYNNSYGRFSNGITRNLYNSGVGGDGFLFLDGSKYNILENLSSFDNIGDGMQIVDGSDVNPVTDNIIRNSSAYNNYQTGLELRRAHNNTIINVTVFNNGRGSFDTPAGFDVREYSEGNTFENCTSYNNGENGGLFFGESGVQNNLFINVNLSQNDVNIWGDPTASIDNRFINCNFNGSRIVLENSSSYFISNWSVGNYSSNISIRYGYLGGMNLSLLSKNFNDLNKKLNVTFEVGGSDMVSINYNESTGFFSKDNSHVFLRVSSGSVSYEDTGYLVNYSNDYGLVSFIFPNQGSHTIIIQEFLSDGDLCDSAYECSGGYCNSGVCASSAASSQEISEGSGTLGSIFKPSENVLNNGYSIKIRETQKVEIPVGKNKKQIVVESVNEEEITISVDGEYYGLNSEQSAKIDLDSDGYYDVEVSINGDTVNGYANLEFRLIHEEVPSEQEEGQQENIIDKIPEVIKKIDWKVYVLIGVVIVLVVLFALLNKNVKRKRRHMLFGY